MSFWQVRSLEDKMKLDQILILVDSIILTHIATVMSVGWQCPGFQGQEVLFFLLKFSTSNLKFYFYITLLHLKL